MEDQGRYNSSSSSSINISSNEGTETERLALIASNEKRKEVQQDVNIIDSSLHFINDLLRNMLDMQRAGSNQIYIERKPTDIMNDIFRPVEAMMHLRDAPFTVIMEVDNGLKSGDGRDDEQLVVMTDSMRLKQVLLNLTRNATKFVENGFIRCSAKVNSTNGLVELRVDDSGPGILPEKRSQVFGKFQQSLDSLQQGTGIGLSLCKKMIDLMGGSLFIDDDYNSGIEGCPGTSFVIQLKILPLQLNEMMLEPEMSSHDRARLRRRHLMLTSESPSPEQALSNKNQTDSANSSLSSASKDIVLYPDSETDCRLLEPVASLTEVTSGIGETHVKEEDKKQGSNIVPFPTALQLIDSPNVIEDQEEQPDGVVTELPKNLSVLFVDDDMILRKLFSRTLRKVNPTWSCMEASSGESAIDLISQRAADSQEKSEDEDGFNRRNEEGDCGFDLIFMDQYMASVQKQLLGTETVRAIRAKGFRTPIICGLSANDVEDAFYHAGSDAFLIKPFPCKKDELEKELLRVFNSRLNKRNQKRNS
jgi:CheY-like chemotaxis protein